MPLRLASALLCLLLTGAAVAETCPAAPSSPECPSHLSASAEAPELISLAADGHSLASLAGFHRARGLARFPRVAPEVLPRPRFAEARAPAAPIPPFHTRRPSPRSAGDDSDSSH